MAKVKGVSVGGDGTVWAVDEAGNIYKREGNAWKRNTHGMAAEVAVGGDMSVWCRNDAGEVFKLGGTGFDGFWEKDGVASGVTSISAGPDGTVWVANKKGQAVMKDGGAWKQSPTAKDAVEVTVGNAGTVYYRNKGGKIFKLNGHRFDDAWVEDGVASQVASMGAGFDGTVWVTNNKDQLITFDNGTWKPNANGAAKQVSVGKAGVVWCVNGDGNVFHAQSAAADTHWTPVAGPNTVVYKIKDGDQLLAILRAKNPNISSAELTKKADAVAKLNGWKGKLSDNYGGNATALKAGDMIILEA